MLLNCTFQRPGTIMGIKAFFRQPSLRIRSHIKGQPLLNQLLVENIQLNIENTDNICQLQRPKDHRFAQPVKKLGIESLFQVLLQILLHPFIGVLIVVVVESQTGSLLKHLGTNVGR